MRLFSILLITALMSLPVTVAAQPASPEASADTDGKQAAGEHFQRGVDLYNGGDYRAALIAFQRAYEIAPNFGVLYNLGQASAELKDYVSALDAFERYLKEGGDAVPADRRETGRG